MRRDYGTRDSETAARRPRARPACSPLRRSAGVLVLLALCAHAYAQPSVSLPATDPAESGGTLPVFEPLYVRISYESDAPLRFQASGWRDGVEVRNGASFNPAPPYPPGRGEAVAWVAYQRPTVVDEVRVRVYDADWQVLEVLDRRIDVAWDGRRSGDRQRAEWATKLSDAQQAMIRAAPPTGGGSDIPFVVMFFLAGWSVPGYWALQIYAAMRVRDRWRKWALLPLIVTLPLLAYTLLALAAGSNLWPLLMIFVCPFVFAYLAALLLLRRWSLAAGS